MYRSHTLQLYILKETLKVFVLAAIAVNLVMNFAAILTFLHRLPLPMIPLIKVVCYRMPQLFPWTFPMALLLAVTLVYGRMAADNEVMAMQASGIHMLWVIMPGMLLGVALSGGLYLVNDYLMPYCRLKEFQVHSAEAANMLPEIFRSRRSLTSGKFQLSWEGAHDNVINRLRVTQRGPKGEVIMTCEAETATYRLLQTTVPGTKKTSYQLQLVGKEVSGINYPDKRFRAEQMDQTIDLTDLEPRDPGIKASSIGQLLDYLSTLRRDIPLRNRKLTEDLAAQRAKTEAKLQGLKAQKQDPGNDEEAVRRIQVQMDKLTKALDRMEKDERRLIRTNNGRLREETNDVLIKVHMRLSLAASALALVLVGMPLGILSGRSHMLKAFVLACVPVLLVYYPLFLLGQNLANTGTLSAATALWGPTVLMTGIGAGLIGYLFRR